MRSHHISRWPVRVVLSATIALGANVGPLHAQPSLRELKDTRTAMFLDRNRSDAERLDAVSKMGYPEEKTLPGLLAIGIDRTQSDSIRYEALRRLPFTDTPEFFDPILKIVDDQSDGGTELDANLIKEITKRITFKPPLEVRRRITAVFRKRLRDSRDKVRLYAFRALVGNHDQVAVNLLADSLRRERNVPIPLHDAIDLLDQDGAANHIGALRPYLNHADPKVQGKAARALALDPQSRSRIVELAKSAETAEEVRLHALRGLAREDEKFASYAIPLLENRADDGDVRHAAMHAFAGRMNYGEVATPDQIRFAQAVDKLASEVELRSTSAGTKIRSDAKELHLHLKQSFPEIKKFYERPP